VLQAVDDLSEFITGEIAVRTDGKMGGFGVVADGTGCGRNTAENLAHVIAAAVTKNTVNAVGRNHAATC
jgi:ribose 5-phosphate isomerase RpiB